MEGNRKDLAKWYIIHTYSGHELVVKESLLQLIENNNLQDDIFDIVIQMEDTIEEKNGKKKVVQRKVMPCYVFIKMIYSNNVWFFVSNTRGVTGFVGPNGRPFPISDQEVQRMQLEKKISNAEFEVSAMVKIVSGPLDGFMGKISSLNDSTQKAKVAVNMFGRDTDIEVDYVQMQKINI